MTKIKLIKAGLKPEVYKWCVGDFFTLNNGGWLGTLVYFETIYFIFWFKESTNSISCNSIDELQETLKDLITYIPNVEIII